MRLLLAGGNAIDAGVAVAAALNVVEPFMSGVGGGGFMQVKTARGEHAACDYAGTIPAGANYSLFDGKPDNANCGPLSPLVPGSAAGWLAVLERFGSKSAAEVFAPAIELAEGGFGLTKKGSEFFESSFAVLDASSWPFRDAAFSAVASTYLHEGQPPQLGAVLRQPELAQTLRTLSTEGAASFYRGELAQKIVAHVQKTGGVLTLEDFATYEPSWVTPVSTTYRGLRVSCLPPPNLGVQVTLPPLF
jgi:gamma-glutamyltranspeptidase/glutathione hydrolase